MFYLNNSGLHRMTIRFIATFAVSTNGLLMVRCVRVASKPINARHACVLCELVFGLVQWESMRSHSRVNPKTWDRRTFGVLHFYKIEMCRIERERWNGNLLEFFFVLGNSWRSTYVTLSGSFEAVALQVLCVCNVYWCVFAIFVKLRVVFSIPAGRS